LSVKSAINAERPWLVIEQTNKLDTGALPTYVFTCFNQGNTPAKIKKISMTHAFVSDPMNLPLPAKDQNLPEMHLPKRTFIVSKDSFEIFPEIDPEEITNRTSERDEVDLSELFLVFHGSVEYHDVFPSWGQDASLIETRWCYVYSFLGGLLSSGPDEYNDHTWKRFSSGITSK
jgi:hypothetical protein